MRKQILTVLILFIPILLFAQQKDEDARKTGIKFSRYVKNDIIYDTRQTENLREGHFLLYPKGEELDADSPHGKFYHGLEFDLKDQQETFALHGFVYEQIVKAQSE